jgi:hypothetical protein
MGDLGADRKSSYWSFDEWGSYMKLRKTTGIVATALLSVLVACGGQLPGEDVAAAAERAREAGSARVALTVESQLPNGALTMTGEGAFDLEARRGTMSLTSSGSGQVAQVADVMGTTEMIYDGMVVYMQMPVFERVLPPGKSWVKMDLEALGKEMGIDFQQLSQIGQNNPTQGLDYLEGVSDVEEVGSDDIRGTPTTHYSGTLDFDRVAEDLPAEQASAIRKVSELSGIRKAPIDVWIDDDGLPRRMTYSFANPGATTESPALGGMTMTTDFFDYGTDVRVEVPPPGATVDIQSLMP